MGFADFKSVGPGPSVGAVGSTPSRFVDGQPTAEILEALGGKRDGLGREATVMLVCDLLRDADPRRERYIIELLRRLTEDPGLTLLEEKKVNRALHDGGRRGNPKHLRRFWNKRRHPQI